MFSCLFSFHWCKLPKDLLHFLHGILIHLATGGRLVWPGHVDQVIQLPQGGRGEHGAHESPKRDAASLAPVQCVEDAGGEGGHLGGAALHVLLELAQADAARAVLVDAAEDGVDVAQGTGPVGGSAGVESYSIPAIQ